MKKSLMKGLQNPRDLTILVEYSKVFVKKQGECLEYGFHIPPRRRREEIIEIKKDCTIGEESKT